MIVLGPDARIGIGEFAACVSARRKVDVDERTKASLRAAREIVDARLTDGAPVYGLNTALGAKLRHRLDPAEIESFQRRILVARACAAGPPLSEDQSRAAVLARIIGLARGASGISLGTFERMVEFHNAGLAPVIPSLGSIGAGDLVQNAHLALPLIGEGEAWANGARVPADAALRMKGFEPAKLAAKDAMALINHSCLSSAVAALALNEARRCLCAALCAAALSFEAYGGNRRIFRPGLQSLRPAEGQEAVARWFEAALSDSEVEAIGIQDPLSFRLIAPVYGTALRAFELAVSAAETELNSSADSPAVLMGEGTIDSSPNFHNPQLAHALRSLRMVLADCAHSGALRIQKLMAPGHPHLPRALSPAGGASAGLVPVQKTANAALAEILLEAQSAVVALPPVSEAVEDMATLSVQHADRLGRALEPFRLIAGIEALAGAQAADFCGGGLSAFGTALRDRIRSDVPRLAEDRALGADIHAAEKALLAFADMQDPPSI